jgi:hemolysin III
MENMERFDKKEELFNSISHGLGVLFAITALVLISVFAGRTGDAWKIVSGVIYGVSLVALFTASTLYHAFPKGKVKDVFEIIDHSAIFILIAGTYTPFTLVSLRGPIKFIIFSTLIYIFMGWLIVFAMPPLTQSLPPAGLFWLVLGGVLYTAGTPFYIIRKIPFNHGIWHLFVLGGSISHFVAVLFYVIL